MCNQILLLNTAAMKRQISQTGDWQKAAVANLIRYVPSRVYFARIRVNGKWIRKSLKTDVLSVTQLCLNGLERPERHKVEANISQNRGKKTFVEAQTISQEKLKGDGSLKTRIEIAWIKAVHPIHRTNRDCGEWILLSVCQRQVRSQNTTTM